MKQLPASPQTSIRVEGATLYRDDLERILGWMRDKGLLVSIRDDTAEFDDLEEVRRTRGYSPHTLLLIAQDPSNRTLEVRRQGDVWTVEGDGFPNLFHNVSALLRERANWLESGSGQLIAKMAAVLYFGAVFFRSSSVPTSAIAMLAGFFVFGAVWVALSGGVNLRYRYEAGFWTRHFEQIVMLIIGTGIGVAGTIASLWIRTLFGAAGDG